MNNPQESPLVIAIREAAYSDISHLAKLFECADTLSDYLPLMQPDNFRQIVINAEQQLSEICFQCMEEIYEGYISENPSLIVSNLRPSFRMIAEVRNIINANNNVIQREISQYECRYQLFINLIQKYEDQLNNTAYTGGVVGAALFGSLGAVLGNIAGGAIAREAAQEQLEERSQKLSTHFVETLQRTNSFLEEMEDSTFHLIAGYAKSIEEKLCRNTYNTPQAFMSFR
jgi:hypothetical protein